VGVSICMYRIFVYQIEHIEARGVVGTYAACAIEKLLAGNYLDKQSMEPYVGELLAALFDALGKDLDPADHNEYTMKGNGQFFFAIRPNSYTSFIPTISNNLEVDGEVHRLVKNQFTYPTNTAMLCSIYIQMNCCSLVS